MNEFELAENLIEGFKDLKAQDHKTTGLGTNIERPEYEDCDFEILRKILHNKGYESNFETIDNHKCLVIYPYL